MGIDKVSRNNRRIYDRIIAIGACFQPDDDDDNGERSQPRTHLLTYTRAKRAPLLVRGSLRVSGLFAFHCNPSSFSFCSVSRPVSGRLACQ